MRSKDYRDLIGGSALITIGLFAGIHSLMFLRMGTVTSMGPGMFPAALAVMLVALGLVILIPSLFRAGELPEADIRPFVMIMLSILAFALTIVPFGLVPAIAVLTLLSSQADGKLSAWGVLILATALSLVASLIFLVGLSVPVAAFSWPW